jgi:Tc toxin complex TcA C-terminal TcB-binding domain/Neuraminidase-like domain
MLSTIEKQLNESQRDALVAGYMKFVGPGLNNVNGATLTIEDLYEYLLLDPEVSDEVMTSRVASAIASVQQYYTRIVNGSEPGFQPVVPSDVNSWRDNDNQYAVWAAGVDVQNYAENYISPSTRLEKSHYFTDLETTLNQNQLDPDRVQNAALTYLNQFEQVSNLFVVSGYIDQDKLETATYYFIGRTTTKPYLYYWRKMDLSKNTLDYQNKPITPNCWSDWLPISLPLVGDLVLEHTVRPVFYNRRLYVAWVERSPIPQKDSNGKDTTGYMYRVNFGYKRFDDTWTAPNSTTLKTRQAGENVETLRNGLVIDESSPFDIQDVNLLATTDFSVEPGEESNPYGRLMLSVFLRDFSETGYAGKNDPIIYGYQYCDSAFNRRELGDQTREELFQIFKDQENTNTLQYAIYKQSYEITKVEEYTDGSVPGGGNLNGSNPNDQSYTDQWWNKISGLQNTDNGTSSRVYMRDDFTVRVELNLDGDFTNDFEFTGADTTSGGYTGFGFCRLNGTLGATVRYHDNDLYTYENTALMYNPEAFGQGSVPDGTWWIYEMYNSGTGVAWIEVDIQGNSIRWSGSGSFGKYIDVSGRELTDWYSAINYSISEDKLLFFFPKAYAFIASLTNFKQVADTRKFYRAIRFNTVQSDETISEKPFTFALPQTSSVFYADIPISEADFSAKQLYINVCLIVGDIRINRPDGSQTGGEQVWRWFKVYMDKVDTSVPNALPQIKSNYDPTLGLVQYLDFCDDSMPARTRLNTTFVRTLIEKASLGLDSLLDYNLQTKKLEAPLDPGGTAEEMDFNSANGMYFWELFFHMPFLVAWRFANEQQFDDAQQWLHYIFDPALANRGGPPPYWSVRPLTDPTPQPSYMLEDPLDPDTQAYAHPIIYKKAVFMAYVSNLVAQGDLWYRQLTRDGLTQARVFYNLAAELLGPRPDVSLSSTWTPKTVNTLAAAQNAALRDFEQSIQPSTPGVLALPGKRIGYLQLADNDNFIAPLNTLLLSHWDALDARLYNLRNNLTVDGKPMSLPLYEPPANPIELLTQRAQSGTLVNGISGAQLVVPPYRFNAILPRVYSAVATLSRFGDSLLSLIERGENASREETQQQHLVDMSSYSIALQLQAKLSLAADRQSLEASRAIAQQRHDIYYTLDQENISSTEQQVMDSHSSSEGFLTDSQSVMTASGALKLVPNIFGFSDGGSRYEGATQAVANGLQTKGQAKGVSADRLATSEGYRRRRGDWQIQHQQAQAEVDSVNKQMDAHTIREVSAQMEMVRLQTQQAQTQTMLKFLQNRVTRASLYQWLNGQLGALYYQVYDAVVSLCLSAQACWQYEMGDFDTTFIQTGAWNDHYRGLQVGETLQLNLQQMEAAYLARHERRLEITKTISLVDLLGGAQAFAAQTVTGQINFELTEKLFDEDYPGHYMRQIKSIAISLPTLLGPYQDVKATLTQTKSSTLLNANIDGVKYLNAQSGNKGGAKIVMNLRASQQIALSSGLNDAGLFALNFGDERFLPYEGTGAVSNWTLAFPRYKSDSQQALLNALTDVIVHVRYTALDGGATFAALVEQQTLTS